MDRVHGLHRHVYDDMGCHRMTNFDDASVARFTFFSGNKFTRNSSDIITNFSRSRGDTIALSPIKFEVLEDIDFKLVKTKMQFKSDTRSSANTIAYTRGDKVKIYFDVYGAKYWMGDGGIFAVLNDQPEDVQLVSSDFIVI